MIREKMDSRMLAAEGPSRSQRLQLAVILGAIATIGPLSIDMYLPALPELARHFETSAALVQLSLTFFLLGLASGQLVAGPLSDVHGRRGPLLIGMLIYTVSSLLCAFSPSIGLLIVLRFIQGLAGSVGVVISRAAVRDLYSGSELTKFFALLMIVNGLGPILAPIIGGQLLRVTTWQGVFFVLFAAGLLFCATILLRLPETLPKERRVKSGLKGTLLTFRGLLRNGRFMGYALSQSFVMAAMFAYISGSSFVLQNMFGVSPQMYSLIFAVNGLGIIITGQIAGRLSGRYGERRLLASGLLLCALGGVLLLITVLSGGGIWPILICLLAVVSSVGMISTTTFSLAMQDQAETAGSASALLGLLPLLLGGCVAPLVGIGGDETALPMAVVIASAGLLSVLSYLLLCRGREGGRQ
ncbi:MULTISPECIES: multidrug effflux MFS transporter [unclassified Paenibacillus]|uniref:multidrug effflux MFS transporter n=2 Tax=Paenibacillus TaxID=44249 RepID=UPI0024067043|nr:MULTISPECIES: multidrug effflux MFS transporter [unclassified Paenibacillus]MDF9839978.1 DHA1 family bicyclomycin/chloramphenicol resistance-like MFS transporter [Paenibacillus sp. PastF-2]MDF9853092.1 DHA1 family bicyclomycin/chloramphenicol resistance-like MFS transporter [Paenibacillus sp. PastF-1]MDH6478404.1 DHA1 family bicyclomycin/chloramphenicol resistance-like MFS transporter [Paenibacillus sp. PastH-2]MDH6506098.1 DHA1 family bicyclomycin/chloramphenicol resistance-like MFS transpo